MTLIKNTQYIKPAAAVTDKVKIISYAEQYLADNEFVVMNDFVHDDMMCPEPHGNTNFIGDIAYKMRNTGIYELKESNNRYVVFRKEKKFWKERYWLLIAIAAFVFGWFADITKEIIIKSIPEKAKSEKVNSIDKTPKVKDSSAITDTTAVK